MSRPTSPETTARILDAALSLLSELGYASASMEATASRAATSKAALYRRWPSKPALMGDAVRHALQVANPVIPRSHNPRRDLKAILFNVVKALRGTAYGGAIAALVGAAQAEPRLARALGEVERERRWILAEPLSRLGVPQHSLDLEIDLLLGVIYFRVLVRRIDLDPKLVERLCDRLDTQKRYQSQSDQQPE